MESDIEHVLQNHKRITDRLAGVIEREAGSPAQTSPITLAIIEGKIDLLRSLGIRMKAVEDLEAKYTACKAEIEKESAPKPDADGWIPHKHGDPMPVDRHANVYVRFLCGREISFALPADEWRWSADQNSGNIIAYKLA